MSKSPSIPGLCLTAEARTGHEWLTYVQAALADTRATTLILDAPASSAIDLEAASALIKMAQRADVAALIVDDWRTARTLGADGVHLTARVEIDDAYRAARAGLEPGAIVGAEAGLSRHDAMMLGEAGADYVAFARVQGDDNESEVDQCDLVRWWSDLFVVPVVAFGIETAGQAAVIAREQPDFIAVRLPLNDDRAAPVSAWAAELLAAIDPAVTGARS